MSTSDPRDLSGFQQHTPGVPPQGLDETQQFDVRSQFDTPRVQQESATTDAAHTTAQEQPQWMREAEAAGWTPTAAAAGTGAQAANRAGGKKGLAPAIIAATVGVAIVGAGGAAAATAFGSDGTPSQSQGRMGGPGGMGGGPGGGMPGQQQGTGTNTGTNTQTGANQGTAQQGQAPQGMQQGQAPAGMQQGTQQGVNIGNGTAPTGTTQGS